MILPIYVTKFHKTLWNAIVSIFHITKMYSIIRNDFSKRKQITSHFCDHNFIQFWNTTIQKYSRNFFFYDHSFNQARMMRMIKCYAAIIFFYINTWRYLHPMIFYSLVLDKDWDSAPFISKWNWLEYKLSNLRKAFSKHMKYIVFDFIAI